MNNDATAKLDDIFSNTDKVKVGEPFELSNTTEIVITQQPIPYTRYSFATEDEYCEYHYQRPGKAAEALFNQIGDESCIAFWLELVKKIRQHCIEEDIRLNEFRIKMGELETGKKHFEATFDKVCGK